MIFETLYESAQRGELLAKKTGRRILTATRNR
jgi:hypothetical protein